MPAGDRTGPEGGGPRTGRNMGYCSGFDAPGRASTGRGRGQGRGRGLGVGRGRGRGFRFSSEYGGPMRTATETDQMPEEEGRGLATRIRAIEKQLGNLATKLRALQPTKSGRPDGGE